MDEKEDRGSCMVISGAKMNNLYPMYFGVSCAFVALEILSRKCSSDMNGEHRWPRTRHKMLQGSAHLLGMLVWRIQKGEAMEGSLQSELLHKLEKAEIEVVELKKMRSEDAKANEKVVGIFATQEQSWLNERRKLRQQIGALMNEVRVQETKKEEAIFDLNRKIKEKELVVESGIKDLKEEEGRKQEVELKLQKVEAVLEEVRETAKKEAQAHSSELWKHKNALIELVSNQRQLESEMGRALRQLEASKQELDSVLEQKEDSFSMVQKLSMEILKTRKDSEQKDKILSAMLRKSKFDTTEKQILLKEVKISKSRRKQADLETERWRTLCGSRNERSSSRSTVGSQFDSRSDVYSWVKEVQTIEAECSQDRRSRSHPKALLLEYLEAEHRKDWDYIATKKSDSEFLDNSDQHSLEGSGELMIKADVKQLEDWVRYETEKNATMLEQRHNLEIDAFAEQLRLKDEKVEAFNWRLLSMELESKRLQTHIDGLEQNLSQFQEENMKLEALLLDREAELESVKEKMMSLQFNHPHYRRTNSISSPKDLKVDHETIWSKVKIIKRKPREREEEPLPTLVRSPQVMETEKKETNPSEDKLQETIRAVQVPEEEIEVEKEVEMDPGYVSEKCASPVEVKVVDKVTSVNPCLIKKESYPWKMDLHALGVSYKIKRLKQQLLMLEKLAGMQRSCEKRVTENNEPPRVTSFLLLMPFLNKQVCRYQTLEENTDNLLKRMHDSNLNLGHIDSSISKTKEETKILQNYLEETFQLQRYVVATGQKLMDVQSKIASDYVRGAEDAEKSAGFDMRRFANSISTLLREVQRGLEVRIARIIGDLEGTLACEGITHLKKQF